MDRPACLRARPRRKQWDDVRSRRPGRAPCYKRGGRLQTAGGRKENGANRKRQTADGRRTKYVSFFLPPASCLLPTGTSKSLPEPDLKTEVVVAVAQIPLRTLFVLRDE